MTLQFSKNNRKLNELAKELGYHNSQVVSFDLPAGHTCPMASECLSKSDKITGKITDGKSMKFRCYAASIEARYTNVRKAHWNNFEVIRKLSAVEIADLILSQLPKNVKVMRIHASGDFFNIAYFTAWGIVALARPDITFFGYTKLLKYVSAPKPSNFKLVYSYGGKQDLNLKTESACYVVSNQAQADKIGVKIACPESKSANDFEYILRGESFAILIHGTQPARKLALDKC